MNSKLTGYEFWKNVLNSPRFVAAPMVDMSELSFRMLCRRYNAELCYSPMLHSQQFLQDFLYRQDTFSTCSEDQPLIVQFCANDPTTFVNAASIVTSQCAAVDLNLGCPQAIAKKGRYGAFLQDDWDLIHSIIKKAANELPVPVTCKMRILPGNFKNSIYYAKMLENAGCSVLTVHGRTREQKGHATGLASWDIIKEIKSILKIPVIANGNILSFKDVQHCLEYTGADAVMSAEALLHNPALFSGKNLPVWEIVEEYLQFAEKFNTPLKYIRSHLFKILYLCIHQDHKIHEMLAKVSNVVDFYSVCDILRNLPEKCSNAEKIILNHEAEIYTNDNSLDNLSEETYESNKKSSTWKAPSEEILENIMNTGEQTIPFWLCHSRPRLGNNEKTKGCYSKYFHFSLSSTVITAEDLGLSKKKFRKMRRHERILNAMKDKRKAQKMRRKQKLAELRSSHEVPLKETTVESIKITKKEQKLLIRERLLKAQGTAPKICINLVFSSEMEIKELARLSFQLRRLYGSNRHSETPLHLFFCSLSTFDELYRICVSKNDGFSSYVVEMTEKAPEDVFNLEDLVYLSPDSDNVLESLEINKIYVIGGIVDESVKKGMTLNHAKSRSIQTARLPINEYLIRNSENPGSTVLTVNQVFDILLKYYETEDWLTALSSNVPQRKGFAAPSCTKDICQTMQSINISTYSNCGLQFAENSCS